MDSSSTAHRAALVAIGGALVQIGYGMLALLFPYPQIVSSGYEALWAVANVGMIAGVVAWLALELAHPRRLAVVGGIVAVLGYLVRIGVSAVIIASPSAQVDAPIVVSIVLMFAGVAAIGVATVRGGRLHGWQAWVPLVTVATGIITASFYSIDKVVHFALLGLLWGASWLLLDLVALQLSRSRGTGSAGGDQSATRSVPQTS